MKQLNDRLKFSAYERDLGYYITQKKDSSQDITKEKGAPLSKLLAKIINRRLKEI